MTSLFMLRDMSHDLKHPTYNEKCLVSIFFKIGNVSVDFAIQMEQKRPAPMTLSIMTNSHKYSTWYGLNVVFNKWLTNYWSRYA